MPRARLDDRIDHPHAMFLVAGMLLVDVTGAKDILVAQILAVDLVGVIGDQHFFLANQRPVVSFGTAVIHIELIAGGKPVRCRSRAVERHVRRPPDPALPRVVQPCAARLTILVHGFVHQQHLAGQPRRRTDFLHEVNHHVVHRFLGHAGEAVVGDILIGKLDDGVFAAGRYRRLPDRPVRFFRAITQYMIPDRLEPVFRERKWNADDRAGHAVPTRNQLRTCRGQFGRVVNTLWKGRTPSARIHMHEKSIRIGLHHGFLALGHQLRILAHVLGIDRVKHIVVCKRVGVMTTGFEIRKPGVCRRGQATSPLRDGAIGVTGPDSAIRRISISTQRGDLFRRRFGMDAGGSQAQKSGCSCANQ